jgi:hypothetical protein
VRTLLDLLRSIEFKDASEDAMSVRCHLVLSLARDNLQILHPENGEEELIEAVSHELAKLRLRMGL